MSREFELKRFVKGFSRSVTRVIDITLDDEHADRKDRMMVSPKRPADFWKTGTYDRQVE